MNAVEMIIANSTECSSRNAIRIGRCRPFVSPVQYNGYGVGGMDATNLTSYDEEVPSPLAHFSG